MTIQLFIKFSVVLMFVIPGLIACSVSIKGSKWFFDSQSNRALVNKIGLKNARVLYLILGLLLLGVAILILSDPRGLMDQV